MKNLPILFISSCFALLCGCMREELPVAPHVRGEVRDQSVSMGGNYESQLWVDLETGSVVHQGLRMDWDLAFECADAGWRIRLNTSRMMLAARTGTNQWDAVKSASGLRFRWDTPDGHPDSLAIGDWRQESGEVMVVDLGYSPEGNKLGYRKMQVLGLENGTYRFRFAALNGSGEDTGTVAKIPGYQYVHYSLRTRQPVQAAPPDDSYDLVFSQYTYVFYDAGNLPYLVTGVLLNGAGVEAAVDSVNAFEAITAANLPGYVFSSHLDAIGYGWKAYDFDTQRYIVFPGKTYLIRDRKGFYWKLHFTDFYDSTGQKGTPVFSYQKL